MGDARVLLVFPGSLCRGAWADGPRVKPELVQLFTELRRAGCETDVLDLEAELGDPADDTVHGGRRRRRAGPSSVAGRRHRRVRPSRLSAPRRRPRFEELREAFDAKLTTKARRGLRSHETVGSAAHGVPRGWWTEPKWH